MIQLKCPFTQTEIGKGRIGYYAKVNRKKYNLSFVEYKFLIYKHSFPAELCEEGSLRKLYEIDLMSIPDFEKKYGIGSQILFFLLDYFGIKKRTMKESSNLITRHKQKKILKEKYGEHIDNISQIEAVKKKKAETCLKNHGVDNIWKSPDYLKRAEVGFIRNYGISRKEKISIEARKLWASKTEEQKQKWLDDSIRSEKCIESKQKIRGFNQSSLEDDLCLTLNKLEIDYVHSFYVRISNRRRYFYDFLLPKSNLVIELNGDYWHANPAKYKGSDLIHYKWDNITAEDIWAKDKIKIDYVESLGYTTLILWEKDLKEHQRNGTYENFIKTSIYDAISKNQENHKNTE